MEELPIELKAKLYENLPLRNIIRLCQVNKEFNSLCNKAFWRTLLKRDFNISSYSDFDPKIRYIIEYTEARVKKEIIWKSLYVIYQGKIQLMSILAHNLESKYDIIANLYNQGRLDHVLTRIIADCKNSLGSTVNADFISKMFEANYTLSVKQFFIDHMV